VDIVAEPLMAAGVDADLARARASDLLARLNIPERLWPLPPATFSGGEQQRVNIARGLIRDFPILLLDEPTAALDRQNRAVVVSLITEARKRGAAVLGIFHDDEVRDAVATRIIDLAPLDAAA
jgi:alpha-D-ribose 1-methylphosphonate 5-triphosphate synthase subunit PhnL